MWTQEQENAAQKLLERLKKEPLFEEQQEFGRLLMKHINSFTPEERKRYEELKLILKNR